MRTIDHGCFHWVRGANLEFLALMCSGGVGCHVRRNVAWSLEPSTDGATEYLQASSTPPLCVECTPIEALRGLLVHFGGIVFVVALRLSRM